MVAANRSAPRAANLRWGLVVGVPVAVVMVAAWQRRWLGDDAFINLRVLRQIGAGHGAVFNEGERVEVATSPAWLVLVGLGHAVTRVRLEWVAVWLGLGCTAGAMAVGAGGARRLHRGDDARVPGWWLPVGLATLSAIPVVWDYATGGLENGLSWLWWAATFALATRATVGHHPRGARWAVFCAGLGPLVRPDLGIVSAIFLGLVLVHEISERDGRRNQVRTALALLGIAVALPTIVQIARMGYYGQLLPNTVYAKEGGAAWWSQGVDYLGDLVGSYALWAATLPLAIITIASLRGSDPRAGRRRLVLVAVGAALAHAALVVRAGGDYMHGRLLLPSLFGLLLPIAVVPLPSTRAAKAWTAGGALALAVWAVVAIGILGPGEHGHGIQDERRTTVASAHDDHPVLVESHVAYLEDAGIDLVGWGKGAPPTWQPNIYGDPALERAAGESPALTFGAMGAVPYRLPLDVHVADQLGLADPVTAHVRLEHRGMPGHEKYLGLAWWAPRLLPDDVVVPPGVDRAPILVVDPDPVPSDDPAEIARRRAAAGDALACGGLEQLRDATTAPLTFRQFGSNLLGAAGLHGFRFSRDPATARDELCG